MAANYLLIAFYLINEFGDIFGAHLFMTLIRDISKIHAGHFRDKFLHDPSRRTTSGIDAGHLRNKFILAPHQDTSGRCPGHMQTISRTLLFRLRIRETRDTRRTFLWGMHKIASEVSRVCLEVSLMMDMNKSFQEMFSMCFGCVPNAAGFE